VVDDVEPEADPLVEPKPVPDPEPAVDPDDPGADPLAGVEEADVLEVVEEVPSACGGLAKKGRSRAELPPPKLDEPVGDP